MSFQYIQSYYKVPAEYGKEVSMSGRKGVIIEAIGQYVGVNFYDTKNTLVLPVHPKDLEYLGKGVIRPLTRSQQTYKEYREVADCFDSFLHFLKYTAHKKKHPYLY
jgi:hypothetical protein